MLWPMADLSRERRRGRLYGIHDSSYRPFEFARRIARIGRGSICFLALLDAGKSENADEKFTGFEDNLLPIYRAIVSLPLSLSLSLSLSRKRCPLRFANTYSSRCDVIHREREREREGGDIFERKTALRFTRFERRIRSFGRRPFYHRSKSSPQTGEKIQRAAREIQPKNSVGKFELAPARLRGAQPHT
jgi:hypothetical protein